MPSGDFQDVVNSQIFTLRKMAEFNTANLRRFLDDNLDLCLYYRSQTLKDAYPELPQKVNAMHEYLSSELQLPWYGRYRLLKGFKLTKGLVSILGERAVHAMM
jgi:hypothetical protein